MADNVVDISIDEDQDTSEHDTTDSSVVSTPLTGRRSSAVWAYFTVKGTDRN
jgi:hypothetical protein